MGFFNKLKLSLSGAEGQMESNILNALDYIKREIGKKDMIKFHNSEQGFFWWFVYGIATQTNDILNPYAPDSDTFDKIFPTVTKALEGYGLDKKKSNSCDMQDEVFSLGRQFTRGVYNSDKYTYMSAIDSIVLLIKK
jgi:hypothetical protein